MNRAGVTCNGERVEMAMERDSGEVRVVWAVRGGGGDTVVVPGGRLAATVAAASG
jgi:hypothetical protein